MYGVERIRDGGEVVSMVVVEDNQSETDISEQRLTPYSKVSTYTNTILVNPLL